MYESLTKLNNAKKEFEAEVKAKGKTIIREAVTEFFNAFPEVESIRWAQYTPYFNDGEACYFGVNDITIKLKGVDEGGDYDDGYEYSVGFDLKSDWGRKEAKASGLSEDQITRRNEIDKGHRELSKAINGLEDALEYVLGDHVQVTITSTEITVDDYEHD